MARCCFEPVCRRGWFGCTGLSASSVADCVAQRAGVATRLRSGTRNLCPHREDLSYGSLAPGTEYIARQHAGWRGAGLGTSRSRWRGAGVMLCERKGGRAGLAARFCTGHSRTAHTGRARETGATGASLAGYSTWQSWDDGLESSSPGSAHGPTGRHRRSGFSFSGGEWCAVIAAGGVLSGLCSTRAEWQTSRASWCVLLTASAA